MVRVKAKKKGKIFFGQKRHEFKEGDEFEIPDEYADRLQHPRIKEYLRVANEIDIEERIAILENKVKKLEKLIQAVKRI